MRVFIAGSGLMGQGIAVDFAKGGCEVVLYDISLDAIERAKKMIDETLKNLGIDETAEAKISYTQNIEDVRNSDIVVEAVYEDLEIKSSVLKDIEGFVADATPICSNTSVIHIDDLAERVKRKGRFLGLHWMNPPYIMPLVEIVTSKHTSSSVVAEIKDFLEKRLGKKVITCKNQSLVNRFNAAVLGEATRMIAEGVRVEDIDAVWKYHLAILYTLFGPLGNLDYIGLDVVFAASQYLHLKYGDEKFRPPEWLAEKVRAGEVGIKSSKGIYEYNRNPEEMYLERVEGLKRFLRFLGLE